MGIGYGIVKRLAEAGASVVIADLDEKIGTNKAKNLGDNEILYSLGLMEPGNDSQTVQAYYKIVEYSLKKIKQNLVE